MKCFRASLGSKFYYNETLPTDIIISPENLEASDVTKVNFQDLLEFVNFVVGE